MNEIKEKITCITIYIPSKDFTDKNINEITEYMDNKIRRDLDLDGAEFKITKDNNAYIEVNTHTSTYLTIADDLRRDISLICMANDEKTLKDADKPTHGGTDDKKNRAAEKLGR